MGYLFSQIEPIVIPLGILLGLLAPLYGLIGGLYVLFFRHYANSSIHVNPLVAPLLGQMREESSAADHLEHDQIRKNMTNVENRTTAAIMHLEETMSKQFDDIRKIIEKIKK